MKALWIVYGLPRVVVNARGGSAAEVKGSWIDGLASAVVRQQLDLQIVVLCIDDDDFELEINGVKFVSVACARHGLAKGGTMRRNAERRIREKIREIAPDIIHIHGTEHVGGSLNESVYCGVPVVISIQGILSQCSQAYTGGIPFFELFWCEFNFRNILKLTSIYKEQKWWGTKRVENDLFIFRRFKYFIGRTEFDRRCLECFNPTAHYFQGEEALNDAFRSVAWSRDKARPHTIYCGNAIGYGLKGGHWLIKAVAMLKDEFPDIKLHIAASAGKLAKRRTFYEWLKASTYTIYIRRLVKKLHCESCVVGMPPLSPQQIAEELATVELFVLPSLCENSPNTLCEAMMVGTPAIATFAGGIPSIMKPDVEGRLVQICDPYSLAGEIRKFFRDHEYAESCIAAARNRAFARHDDNNNARILLNTYHEVLRLEDKLNA